MLNAVQRWVALVWGVWPLLLELSIVSGEDDRPIFRFWALGAQTQDSLIRLPVKVGNYVLTDSAFVGNATAYRYSGPGAEVITVFVYPRPSPSFEAGATLPAVLAHEAQLFVEALEIQRTRHELDDYRIAFQDSTTLKVGRILVPKRTVAAAISRAGVRYVTLLTLYEFQERVVKVRSSQKASTSQSTRFGLFPDQLLRAIVVH